MTAAELVDSIPLADGSTLLYFSDGAIFQHSWLGDHCLVDPSDGGA